MPKLVLAAPLAGWVAPLDEVPDDVFAKRIIGDGVAIDPIGSTLFAPCDGTVVAMAAHAVTLRADGGGEFLMHLGIDSVALAGEGFVSHVRQGQTVRVGDELISFNLEFLASRVKSLLSPIVVTNGNAFRIVPPRCGRSVTVGDPILEVIPCVQIPEKSDFGQTTVSREIVCMLPNGLHARPAARLAGVAKACQSRICLTVRGRKADAASVAAQMALGLAFRDRVLISADGPDAEKALSAVVAVLASDDGETMAPVPSVEVAAAVPGVIGTTVRGTVAVPGLAIGKTRIWRFTAYDVPTDGLGIEAETRALKTALDKAKRQLRRSTANAESETGILAAHEALLDDPDLMRRATTEIAAGRSAGYAWRVAVRTAAEDMRSLENVRLRSRADDFADLEGQVLSQLTNAVPATASLSPGTILLAETLYPSQLAALDSKKIAGIVMAGGGPTSHVALLAAAMNVPMLTGVGKVLAAVPEGVEVVLDAEAGTLDFAPSPERLAAVRMAMTAVADTPSATAAAACRTADGVRIEVFANLGGGANEAAAAVKAGAEGCGLLRSEFLFLDRANPPDEDEQYAHYQAAVDVFADRPVILRTFDIGADKPAPYLPQLAEENPALGMRGIRLALHHKDMLRTQIRAAMRVRPAGRLKLMLPMVSDISELLAVRDLMMQVGTELSVAPLPFGIMIETPAAAIMADKLAALADFLSIGTNDLTQYTLAMDRIHPELAVHADGLHPAILRLIAKTVSGAKAIPVGVCGALAADPLAAAILIGLGVGELSVPVAVLAGLKRKISTLTLSDCRVLAEAALSCATSGEVRALARAVKDGKA